ncbi:hypothetical protein LAJ19_06880 [Deinococcus taeanensis]|uniref:hypothetical protein n=1 Tax=Deinococcus taeanensis TaxID=2737050 RepID=UPI001CDD64D6|nr:hypothetical protein [Deinococcus taeanensis]UBV43930.1 hypothetical protein LAJ19_06880 [Deinococcus taeanensis]
MNVRHALLCGLLLTACAPVRTVLPTLTPALNLSGPAPDVVVLSVSGRCGVPCAAPRDNWDYLSSRGAVDRVAAAFQDAGLSVQVAGYASHPARTFTSTLVNVPQRGYAALEDDLKAVKRTWLSGPRPPRMVLLGHSQGVAWTHQLTRDHPDVTFDVQIDLDGICLGWKTDFRPLLRGAGPYSPLTACDRMMVAGRLINAKDVVWTNVRRGLEVQSKRLPERGAETGFTVNYLFELGHNVRLDGTDRALDRFVSVREDHSAITYPNSEGMTWVAAQLAPLSQGWAAEAQGHRP